MLEEIPYSNSLSLKKHMFLKKIYYKNSYILRSPTQL